MHGAGTIEKSSSFKDCEQFLWKISTICIDAPCRPAFPAPLMFSDFDDDFSFGILLIFFSIFFLSSAQHFFSRACAFSPFSEGEENLIFLNLLEMRACVYEWIIWIKIYSAIKARKCSIELEPTPCPPSYSTKKKKEKKNVKKGILVFMTARSKTVIPGNDVIYLCSLCSNIVADVFHPAPDSSELIICLFSHSSLFWA